MDLFKQLILALLLAGSILACGRSCKKLTKTYRDECVLLDVMAEGYRAINQADYDKCVKLRAVKNKACGE